MMYGHDQGSCGAIRLRLLAPYQKITPYRVYRKYAESQMIKAEIEEAKAEAAKVQ